MEATDSYLPPGDPKLVANIVNHLKAQGIFDQFRHDCLADVDTKPSYQNLRQRVDGFVSKLLSNETWSPELNKNQLRNDIRRQIDESGMLALGVEHVVEQVVNAKIYQVFLPKIEVIVREYLSKIEQVKEDVSGDKKCDSVDVTQKVDARPMLVDKPVEILKEATGESVTKSQKCKEDGLNHESSTLDLLIRPEVEKNTVEKRGGLTDRSVDTKLSSQIQDIDLKQAENTERKENVEARKTPDGKGENRLVNSKLHTETTKNKQELDVIRRLDKSWLKQREKARLKYEEPLVDSERNVYNRDISMSPEKNKTSSQDDLSKHSDSTKTKKSEDSTNIKSSEKSSKNKPSSSKIYGSKTRTDLVEESKNDLKSTSVNTKPSKSGDSGNNDIFKNTGSEGSRSDIKGTSGSSKSSKSTESKNRETSKNFKVKTDYEKAKSLLKSESKSKSNKYPSESSNSSSKSKSEKRESDLSKKADASMKQQRSRSPSIPKKEKDDKNKYLKKELSVEKKLQEYNRLVEQKTFDGRVKRESSVSSQGSIQEMRNNEYDVKQKSKSDSKKTKWQISNSPSKLKGTSDAKLNNKIKTRMVSDIPEGSKKQDFKHLSPVDLNEGKSSSNSSTRESLFGSSESDNFDESGQSSGSSITEQQRKELCSDGRRCNTPPSSHASTSSRESRSVENKSYHKDTDSPTKRNEHSSSNIKAECLSSDTVSNSLNDSMFLSSASSSSDESFLSHHSVKERHSKTKTSQDDSGNKSDGAWSCVSSVSSVHTSDLSSFDDKISLSSSDEENTQKARKGKKKKKKKRLPLNQVKQIAEEKETGSFNSEVSFSGKPQSEKATTSGQRKEKVSSEAADAGWSDSKDYSSSDEDTSNSHVVDSSRKTGRKRKRNSKSAARDSSSVYSSNKRADTRKSTDRFVGDVSYSSELQKSSVEDFNKKGNCEWDKAQKLSPKKATSSCEEKGESNAKSHPLSNMDIRSSISVGNDSSSDFSDIISDDLSSDDEKDMNISSIKSEPVQDRKDTSESSLSSSDSDEEITEQKIHPKRKYIDSNEYKTSDSKEASSIIKNGHYDHDNTSANGSYKMHSSGISNIKTEKSEIKNFNFNSTRASPSEGAVPRKRGRPRKYPVGYVYYKPAGEGKRRGRPRKYPINDGNKSREDNASSSQKTGSLPPHRSSSTHSKEGQVCRKSQENTGSRRNSRRLSAGCESSEPVARPLRRPSDHSSSDLYKTETQHNRVDTQHSSKWYDSSDLYKPRPVISSSSRRSRAHLPS